MQAKSKVKITYFKRWGSSIYSKCVLKELSRHDESGCWITLYWSGPETWEANEFLPSIDLLMLVGKAAFRTHLEWKEGRKEQEKSGEEGRWNGWMKTEAREVTVLSPTPTQTCAVVAGSEGDLSRLWPQALWWCPEENEGKLSVKNTFIITDLYVFRKLHPAGLTFGLTAYDLFIWPPPKQSHHCCLTEFFTTHPLTDQSITFNTEGENVTTGSCHDPSSIKGFPEWSG